MFLDLPNEILFNVAAYLNCADCNSLAQTSHRSFHIFDYYLYHQDDWSTCALWWAAQHDNAETAQKAVEAGAITECPVPPGKMHRPMRVARGFTAGRCCTPLMVAAAKDNHSVLEYLIEIDPGNINHQNRRGFTPLFEAVRRNSVRAIRALLDSDAIDANIADYDGETPLHFAASKGVVLIATLLLDSRKFEPDITHPSLGVGRTPLSYAAEAGSTSIGRLLLETGRVDPDSRDLEGKTPLAWASKDGRFAFAELLLETGRVDPDSRDDGGMTPLMWALEGRRPDIAQLLFETGRVDLDARYNLGSTPLMMAIKKDLPGFAELLIETGKVDPDATDDVGTTPLMLAIENRLARVAELLLKTGKVHPDARGRYGDTPLILALKHRLSSLAKLLLETGKVNPDSSNSEGETPLLLAAKYGLSDIAMLLLKTYKVNPDPKDSDNKTPLIYAVQDGNTDLAKSLLETGAVDPNARSPNSQWTLLTRSIVDNREGSHDGVIQVLVDHQGTDLEAQGGGATPLVHAADRNNAQLVRRLMDSGRVDPDAVTDKGTTAAHIAVSRNRTAAAEVLLGYDHVDFNKRDVKGFTPLGRAAYSGCAANILVLLRSGRVEDINARCGRPGGTPLWWAAVKDRKRAARALCEHGGGKAEFRCPGDRGRGDESRVDKVREVMTPLYKEGLVKKGAWCRTFLEY